jgi:tRNA-dihydrouridine synthase B
MANADQAPPPPDAAARARAVAFARGYTADPRLARLSPQFDAPFFQAGLAGYSDGAMRLIARQHGCPFCVTEALLDRKLLDGGRGKRQEDPDLLQLEARGLGDPGENRAAGLEDHPVAGQVMGTEPEMMARGAQALVEMGYDVIDVNLACPVKKIRKRKRGGHFLAAPDDAIAVLGAVREAVPDDVPCSVKLRRAFDDTPEMAVAFERIFDAAYEVGYTVATVHARTVQQKYNGPARWPFLADLVARYPDRMIFGSGDVWAVEDIFAMLESTGVSAVSVARGCIGNPWIFRQARAMLAGEPAQPPSVAEQREVLFHHHRLAMRLYGERSATRQMRKFGIRFSAHHPAPDPVRRAFIDVDSNAAWQAVLADWYDDESAAA